MLDTLSGFDRRAVNGECPLHEGMVEWIKEERDSRKEDKKEFNDKLDKIIERQQDNYYEIIKIKGIISNGLQATTKKTSDSLSELCLHVSAICEQNNKHFAKLDEFNWFRDWVNDLRNHMFKYAIMFGVAGGAIWSLIYYGRQIVTAIIRGI